MRFTSILHQVNYHRHFNRIWSRQGKMEVKPLVLSQELQEMRIKIEDAKEILHETKMFKPKKSKVAELSYPLPPSVFTPGARYYRMHGDVQVSENENQALSLTKTIPYNGLPKKISSLIGNDSLPNQDELVQTSILQAQVWDAMQEKLPKIVDPKRPGYVFKRQFGIEYGKKVLGLLEKLSFLCDSATGKYADCFQRHKALNAFCEIGIKRCGSNIAFQMPCDILLKAKTPLQPFASTSEIKATENESVPDIYPIKPTLDLEKCHENPISHREISVPNVSSYGNIHTLFIGQKSVDPWLPRQQLAKAIATCFAFSAAEARNKYGDGVGILPDPINIQCMYMDAKSANFLAYQLNTLKLNDNDGIKNQVWIDEAADFYSSVSELDLITGYNPSIFPKMLALHINGFHSASN